MTRKFTKADVKPWIDGSRGVIYTDIHELEMVQLDWQVAGLRQTASGYGAKLTTCWKINYEGRLYRIYTTLWSNAGSVWFQTKEGRIYIS